MPSLNTVSYNSSRVQRAYRINNVETLKLTNRIQLLEKERVHKQRLTNQDIRLISLTLDYIQQSSGHSSEGLAPGQKYVQPEDEVRTDKGPCFLYGERIVSRKKRRNLRPQSAMDKSVGRLTSESATSDLSEVSEIRPQSSPMRSTFVTHLSNHLPRENGKENGQNGDTDNGSTNPACRFKPAWTSEPMPDVTKVLLRANNSPVKENSKRNSIFERSEDFEGVGGSAVLKTLTRNLRIQSQTSIPDGRATKSAKEDRRASRSPERGSRGITDIINRGPKVPMSANAWKSHLNQPQQPHQGPMSSAAQRQYILDSKKTMNNARTEGIRKRVKTFVAKITPM